MMSRLTSIIICRFILNLRQVKSPGDSWVSGSGRSLSLRFVGNAGEPLRFGAYLEENGVEEGQPVFAQRLNVPAVDKTSIDHGDMDDGSSSEQLVSKFTPVVIVGSRDPTVSARIAMY